MLGLLSRVRGGKKSEILVKDGKTDYIQDHYDRCRDHHNGGEETGLKSECSISKWEFIAEEQGRGQWMENY